MFPEFDPINNPRQALTFYKEFEGARFPERGSDGAAGMDFFIPKPENINDSCFEFMKKKCLDSVETEEIKKAIECNFNDLKGEDPERAFLNAVALYNKYVFGTKDFYEVSGDIVDFKVLYLEPGQGINIPSGISADIPHGYAIDFRNKSGIATKKSLVVGAELVDEDYTGIMHLNIHNIGKTRQQLSCGMKIAQAVIERTYYDNFNIKTVNGKMTKETVRGDGGFGSTGI